MALSKADCRVSTESALNLTKALVVSRHAVGMCVTFTHQIRFDYNILDYNHTRVGILAELAATAVLGDGCEINIAFSSTSQCPRKPEGRNFKLLLKTRRGHWAWGRRYVYFEGLRERVPTGHSLVLCFMVGPLGLLSHMITCSLHRSLRRRNSSATELQRSNPSASALA